MELLELYYDVLIKILEEVEPEDLAALAQTSWAFNGFVKGNTRLYKAHYLKSFDAPRRKPTDAEPDWISELQRLVKCRKVLQSQSTDVKTQHFEFVFETIDTLITKGSEQNKLIRLFSSPPNAYAFLHKSSLYGRAGTEFQSQAPDPETRQLSAKLHCLYGIPHNAAGRRTLSIHPFARSRLYDLRYYTKRSRWGPFRNDGSLRVDWETIESTMIILAYNNGLCSRRCTSRFTLPWSQPFSNVFCQLPLSSPGLPLEPSLPLHIQDPYAATGIWAHIVCFVDYDDLYSFNFSVAATRTPAGQPFPPIIMEEGIRHLLIRVTVTAVTAPAKDDDPSMPVVHFAGPVRAVDTNTDANSRSRIRGCVRMTKEGEVRWSYVWLFNGDEERWRTEAVQVGGLRSKRGVVGIWYDKGFDPHGPAGPTTAWKVREEIGDEEGNWWDD